MVRFSCYNGQYDGRPNDPNPFHFEFTIVKRTYDNFGTMIAQVDVIPRFHEKGIREPNNEIYCPEYPLVNSKSSDDYIYDPSAKNPEP